MFNDTELNELSAQAKKLGESYDVNIKSHEPISYFGSFKIDFSGEGLWSRVKIKKRGDSFVAECKAIYNLDCDFNPGTEVEKCSCIEGIKSYSKDGRNYLKGEKDVWVDWIDSENRIPELSMYAEEIMNPVKKK